ncbi:MAG: menaquinone biosynthesis protein [Thermoguttaceae bacterium]|nr:menaquinone biosynthesis protein [Thermoguttaceae bacterium]
MPDRSSIVRQPLRIGAVRYLNAWPLVFRLAEHLPEAEIHHDLPSRLADGLRAGRLDVAMIPSVECFRIPGATIISDACIATSGPVRSVMLYGRVPVERIRTLALDEGSRTSAALARILLIERFGIRPRIEQLPIGASWQDTQADAVMLVGDRGLLPPDGDIQFVWDLGEQWHQWTGLPFVFAMWVGRPGVSWDALETPLSAARDAGVQCFSQIAREASAAIGVPEPICLAYLRDHLVYRLGPREREGLHRFHELAVTHGLAPAGVELVFVGRDS